MKRVLEPELMDDEQQAVAYARADFSASNQWYADHLQTDFPQIGGRVVDIGCGPADVPLRIAKAVRGIRITAVDGSGPMIELARRAVQEARLDEQITLVQGYVPGLALEEESFDAVLSKDFLHHLPDPFVLWNEAKRLGRPGAVVYVMDLHRPETSDAAKRMVEETSAADPPVLQRDFYNSLCAAFTVEEVAQQLRDADLPFHVARVSERHLLIKGTLPGFRESARSFRTRLAP